MNPKLPHNKVGRVKIKTTPPKRTKTGGQPRIEIDLKKVRDLARTMCTQQELATALGISWTQFKERKLQDPRIQEAIDDGKNQGCFSLRAKQMQVAMSGNTHMLKWCGQQYLKQKHNLSHASDPENPLPPQHQNFNFANGDEAYAALQAYLQGQRGKPKKK